MRAKPVWITINKKKTKNNKKLWSKDSYPLFTVTASTEQEESKICQLCQSITNKFTSLSIYNLLSDDLAIHLDVCLSLSDVNIK